MFVLDFDLCFRQIYVLSPSRFVRWEKGGGVVVVLLHGISSNLNRNDGNT